MAVNAEQSARAFRGWRASNRPLEPTGRDPYYALTLILGLCLAAGVGALIGIGAHLPLIVLLGVAASVTLVIAFNSRPFSTLIGLWIFLLLQSTAAALVGSDSVTGRWLWTMDTAILAVLLIPAIYLLLRDRPAGWRVVLWAGGGFVAGGLFSAALSGVPLYIAFSGAFLAAKFYVVLAISLAAPWTHTLATRVARILISVAALVAVAGIADFASGGYLRVLLDADVPEKDRLGLTPGGGIFHNVAVLGTFMSLGLIALLAKAALRPRQSDVVLLFLMILAAIVTLRLKVLFTIPIGVLALAVVMPEVRRKLWSVTLAGAVILVIAGPLAFGVAEQQIGLYTSRDLPRTLLMKASVEMAVDHFPGGVGFGQFGSAPSIDPFPYSPVYHEYGLSSYSGLAPNADPTYALDTTWAAIVGETGVVGFASFAGGILVLVISLYQAARRGGPSRSLAATGFAVLCVLLVDSLGRATFIETFSVLTAALFLGPAVRLGIGQQEQRPPVTARERAAKSRGAVSSGVGRRGAVSGPVR